VESMGVVTKQYSRWSDFHNFSRSICPLLCNRKATVYIALPSGEPSTLWDSQILGS
jgi:hypothetical protein